MTDGLYENIGTWPKSQCPHCKELLIYCEDCKAMLNRNETIRFKDCRVNLCNTCLKTRVAENSVSADTIITEFAENL